MSATVTCYASLARTVTPTAQTDQNNKGHKHRGIRVAINVTAVTSTPSVVFTIQGKDPLSGTYYTLLASAAITGTGITVLQVYPGLVAVTNLAFGGVLPLVWRVIATHGNANSITYSVGAELIP